MHMNKITVEIFGERYALKGDLPGQQVQQLAQMVDERMRTISQSNPRLPNEKVAVLAALHLANEYIKLNEDYNQLLEMLEND